MQNPKKQDLRGYLPTEAKSYPLWIKQAENLLVFIYWQKKYGAKIEFLFSMFYTKICITLRSS